MIHSFCTRNEVQELLKKCGFMVAVNTMKTHKPGYGVLRNESESQEKGHSVIDK